MTELKPPHVIKLINNANTIVVVPSKKKSIKIQQECSEIKTVINMDLDGGTF